MDAARPVTENFWRTYAPACWILALVVPFFLVEFLWPQPIQFDALSYLSLSQQIDYFYGLPYLPEGGFRTYGYPFFLSLFDIFGFPASINAAKLTQLLFLVAVIASLRYRFFPASIRLDCVLAGLLLLSPFLASMCATLLSDVLAVCLVQWGILAGLSVYKCSTFGGLVKSSAFVGGLLGFATQIRPGYYFFALAAAGIFLLAGSCWRLAPAGQGLRLRRLVFALGFSLGYLTIAAPTFVAQAKQGQPLRVTPSGELSALLRYHLMLGLYLDYWSSLNPPLDEFRGVLATWAERGWSPSAPPSLDEFKTQALRKPKRTLGRWGKHIFHAFTKTEAFPYQGPNPIWLRVILAVVGWGVLVAFVFGLARLARSPLTPVVGLWAQLQLLLLGYLAVTLAPVVPEERHTLAIWPAALVVVAGWIARVKMRGAI